MYAERETFPRVLFKVFEHVCWPSIVAQRHGEHRQSVAWSLAGRLEDGDAKTVATGRYSIRDVQTRRLGTAAMLRVPHGSMRLPCQLYCTCHSFDPPMDWQVGKVRWLGHASLAMTSFASSRWLARLTLAGKQPQQQTSAAQPPPPTTALHFTSSTLARHTHTHDHCIVCLQPSRHTSPPSPSWQSTMASSCLA